MSNEVEEWKKRALEAERERDEWRQKANDEGAAVVRREEELAESEAACERAEADNAALLDAVSKYRTTRGEEYCQCQGRGTCRACALEMAMSAAHPGAALLAEVEALRKFTAAVRAEEWQSSGWQGFCLFRHATGCHGGGAMGAEPKPHDEGCPFHVLTAVDALKGEP